MLNIAAKIKKKLLI